MTTYEYLNYANYTILSEDQSAFTLLDNQTGETVTKTKKELETDIKNHIETIKHYGGVK